MTNINQNIELKVNVDSSDIIHNPASCVFDVELTTVIGGNMVKVMGWYDNEWGYSNRLLDLAGYISERVSVPV
jgi:glyceraldehyde 3-phosphate dehydrogenase